jgi:hypothetical protein
MRKKVKSVRAIDGEPLNLTMCSIRHALRFAPGGHLIEFFSDCWGA